MEKLLRLSPYQLEQCPTCKAKPVEVAHGVYHHAPSTHLWTEEERECKCKTQIALYESYLLARIPEKYMRYSDGDWNGDPKAMEEATRYLNEFPQLRIAGIGLGFHAEEMGVGKTFLATYLARKLLLQGEAVAFIEFRDLLNIFEMPWEKQTKEEQRVRDTNVLVVDEIMRPYSEAQSAFFGEMFESILRYRSNYNKPTIYTTNLEPEEIEKMWPRAWSVLSGTTRIIKVLGTDYRQHEALGVEEEAALNKEVKAIC